MTKVITKKDYEKLMEANERELWELTEAHYKLVYYVQDKLWPCACLTASAVARKTMADELFDLGCEVEA